MMVTKVVMVTMVALENLVTMKTNTSCFAAASPLVMVSNLHPEPSAASVAARDCWRLDNGDQGDVVTVVALVTKVICTAVYTEAIKGFAAASPLTFDGTGGDQAFSVFCEQSVAGGDVVISLPQHVNGGCCSQGLEIGRHLQVLRDGAHLTLAILVVADRAISAMRPCARPSRLAGLCVLARAAQCPAEVFRLLRAIVLPLGLLIWK
jgi:hypothetical protein